MAIITWTHSSFHHALTERCGAVSLIVDMLTVSSRTRALDIAHLALEREQAHGIVDQQLLLDCGLPSRRYRTEACDALEKLPSKHVAMLQESDGN
jgi:hypothetical protein